MKRKKGFYWIRPYNLNGNKPIGGRWIIAYWQGDYWELTGSNRKEYFYDENFQAVTNEPIKKK